MPVQQSPSQDSEPVIDMAIALYELNVTLGFQDSIHLIADALRVSGQWDWALQRKLDNDIAEVAALDADAMEVGAFDVITEASMILDDWERIAERADLSASADDGIYTVRSSSLDDDNYAV